MVYNRYEFYLIVNFPRVRLNIKKARRAGIPLKIHLTFNEIPRVLTRALRSRILSAFRYIIGMDDVRGR